MSQSTSLFSYPVGTLLFAVSDHHTIVPIKVADVQCIDEQSEGSLYRLTLTLETPENGEHPSSVGSAFEAYFNTFYVRQDALPEMVFLTLDEACLRALENCAEEIGYQERIVSNLKSKQASLIAKRGYNMPTLTITADQDSNDKDTMMKHDVDGASVIVTDHHSIN